MTKTAADRASHFELARQYLYTWRNLQAEWSRVFNAAFREEFGRAPSYGDIRISGIGNDMLSAPIKEKLRDINTRINSALDAAHMEYKLSGKRSWAKFKEQDTPTMKREKRAGTFASHSAREENPRGLYVVKLRDTQGHYIPGNGGAFRTLKEAQAFVRSAQHAHPGATGLTADGYAVPATGKIRQTNPDIHIDIGSHNTKGKNVRAKKPRAKNPSSVHNKARGHTRMVLVLTGHPQGKAWWTGKVWDTVRKNARVIENTRLADVVAMARKLGAKMPARYRIEVHSA